MTLRIQYGAGNTDCTCQVVVVYENTYGENEVYDYEIQYCPKHEAAEAMYEALESIRDLARTGVAPDSFMLDKSGWDQHKLSKIARSANDALAQAGGKER